MTVVKTERKHACMGQLIFQKLRFSPDLRRQPQTNKPWKGSARQHFYSLVLIENPLWTFSGSSPRLLRTTCPWKIFVGLTTNSVQIFNTWYTRRGPCLSVKKKTSAKRVRYSCDLEMIELSSFEWGSFGHHIVPAARDHLFYSVKFFISLMKVS